MKGPFAFLSRATSRSSFGALSGRDERTPLERRVEWGIQHLGAVPAVLGGLAVLMERDSLRWAKFVAAEVYRADSAALTDSALKLWRSRAMWLGEEWSPAKERNTDLAAMAHVFAVWLARDAKETGEPPVVLGSYLAGAGAVFAQHARAAKVDLTALRLDFAALREWVFQLWREQDEAAVVQRAIATGTETVYRFADGWKVVWLRTVEAVEAEGAAMANCVGEFCDTDEAPWGLFSFRDEKGKPRITLMFGAGPGFWHQPGAGAVRQMSFDDFRALRSLELSQVKAFANQKIAGTDCTRLAAFMALFADAQPDYEDEWVAADFTNCLTVWRTDHNVKLNFDRHPPAIEFIPRGLAGLRYGR